MTTLRTFRTALICCVALCGLMLGGCRSSRSSVKGSQGRVAKTERTNRGGSSKPATSSKPINLSDIDDPMARDLISEANNWLGTPYSYGGTTTGGTDCSGLVMSLYRDVTGVKIPRSTREQVRYCTNVARNKMRPGDLVFFASGSEVSHVGLYVGNGSMIHASSSRGVVVSDIDTGYWGQRYKTGGRVEPARDSWAALNKGKRGKTKPAKDRPAPASPVAPPESPTQIIYDHGELASAAPATAPAATPSIPVSEVGNILSASKNNTPATTAAEEPLLASSTPAQTADAPAGTTTSEKLSEIDLLDLIITQKTDSIFSSQFLD